MVAHPKKKGAKKPVASNSLVNAQRAAAMHFANTNSTDAEAHQSWLTKLQSADPADREDGCIDVSTLSQTPSNLPILLQSGAPAYLAAALGDAEMHVRSAAAAAVRNMLLQLSVHNAGTEGGSAKAGSAAVPVEQYISAEFCAGVAVQLATGFQLLVAPDSDAMQSNGQPLTEAHLAAIAGGPLPQQHQSATAAHAAGGEAELVAAAVSEAETKEEGEEEGGAGGVEGFETMRDAAFANVDEFIQLIGVVADCSEAATEFFSDTAKCSVLPILASAIEVGLDPNFNGTLNRSRGMELFVSSAGGGKADGSQLAGVAAEALHLMSRDNAPLGAFLATGLTPAQQKLFNDLTATTPTSPSMLLISLRMASSLLGTSPTMANAERAVPSVTAALSTLPFAEWRRVLPLLTEGCELAEDLRRASVRQSLDRYRALQLAADVFGEVIAVVCEAHNDEEDDEAAFARNPHASLVMGGGGAVSGLVAILTDVFSPQDAVLQKALREVTDNAEVSAIQHAYAAAEVGIFGVVSALLHLLPVSALGPADVVWRTCVSVLTARHELVTESIGCPEGPHPSLTQLILQIESLTEMCWTVLRKDAPHGQVQIQPSDLDLFTRIAWEGYVSTPTIVFVISVVGCVGTRVRAVPTHTACARFCVAVISHALSGVAAAAASQASGSAGKASADDNMDIAVEAANVTIDLFSDEAFDATVYTPLGVQAKLRELLPVLKQHVASFGKKRSPKKSHFIEVRDNLAAFIEYKQQHGCN